MANVELRSKRPLSPHLTVFRRYVNMVMSILHRVTGVANYFAILLPVAWLVAAASGEDIFAFVNGLFATPLGLLVLFGASWSLIHHALGGIRHFKRFRHKRLIGLDQSGDVPCGTKLVIRVLQQFEGNHGQSGQSVDFLQSEVFLHELYGFSTHANTSPRRALLNGYV